MKVLLLGASGFSGKAVLSTLLRQNHQVTAVTRRRASIPLKHQNLKIVEGDVLAPQFLRQLLPGHTAVINCLGIGGKGTGQPNTFVSDATRVLVEAMEDSTTKRLICMSNVGAGDSLKFQPWLFSKVILPYFMRWLQVIIEDKNRMEPIIQNSGLQWTILRFPNITDKPPKGRVHATLNGQGLKLSITNEDLAVFLVEQLSSTEFLYRSPSVSN